MRVRDAVLLLLLASASGYPSGPVVVQSPSTATLQQIERLLDQRRWTEARDALAPFTKAGAMDHRTCGLAGRASLGLGDPQGAIHWLEEATLLDPSCAGHHMYLARALVEKARSGSALDWAMSARRIRAEIERAIELEPSNLEARMDRVRFLVMAPLVVGGSVRSAREEARRIANADEARGCFARGYIHYREKEYAEADRELKRARQLAPRWVEPLFWLGYLYQETRQYERAFETQEAILRIEPGRHEACLEIARTAMYSGLELARGLECARIHLEAVPAGDRMRSSTAHFVLGSIHKRLEQIPDARREFQAALRLDPDNDEARAALKSLD